MLETLYKLGIKPFNSRPRVSKDNPYAESLFKTLKYRPNYHPKGFENLGEADRIVEKRHELYEQAKSSSSGEVEWSSYQRLDAPRVDLSES